MNIAIKAIAIGLSTFHLYVAIFGTLTRMQQSGIHLLAAILLGYFALFVKNEGDVPLWKKIYRFIFALSGAASGVYIVWTDIMRDGRITEVSTIDIIFGVTMVIVLLDVTRIKMGWAMPIIAAVALIYSFIGPYLPGIFAHRGFSLNQMVQQLFLYTEGIFGTPLMIAATYVIVFLIFGSFLEVSGGGKFFIDLATALFGRFRGGPAKVAVVSSAMFGSINGTATANVVSTGTITIPLMKKVGYAPRVAGAVEAVASSGGQITPPVMGAAVFIMAQMIGVQYSEVMIAAIFPALLYYVSVFVSIDIESAKFNVKRTPKEEMPDLKKVLKEGWFHFIPLTVLIYCLSIAGYSPMRSALIAVISVIVVSAFSKKTRLSFKQILHALEDGAKTSVIVAYATAVAGIIIGVFNITGLGLNLSRLIIDISGGSLLMILIITMLTSIVLGMGLPTVAAYLILAITVAPALTQLGLDPMAAHMFVFYFGILSAFTPPVAIAAYAAGGIADCDPMEVAITACKIGIAAFLIPYLFVYSNEILLMGTPLSIVIQLVIAFVAVFALVIFVHGYFVKKVDIAQRIILIPSLILMIVPNLLYQSIGLILFAIVAGGNYISYRKSFNLSTDINQSKIL